MWVYCSIWVDFFTLRHCEERLRSKVTKQSREMSTCSCYREIASSYFLAMTRW
jgi:hypothetical protein